MNEGQERDMSLFADAPRREDLIVVMPHHEDVALAAATAVSAEARQAVRRRNRFSVALSGGDTPKRTYELLAQAALLDDVPWACTHVFWGDERCVGPEDSRSNERMAREALLDHVPVPAGQVHPIRCGQDSENGAQQQDQGQRAERAAERYDRLLREQGSAMDLILLGLGEDGHTASLFPGSDALSEGERWAVPVLQQNAGRTSGSQEDRLWRVTLTADFINQAAAVFFIVTGAAKAEVLRAVMSGDAETDGDEAETLPARLIRPSRGRLCWFLDEEAASQLEEERLS